MPPAAIMLAGVVPHKGGRMDMMLRSLSCISRNPSGRHLVNRLPERYSCLQVW